MNDRSFTRAPDFVVASLPNNTNNFTYSKIAPFDINKYLDDVKNGVYPLITLSELTKSSHPSIISQKPPQQAQELESSSIPSLEAESESSNNTTSNLTTPLLIQTKSTDSNPENANSTPTSSSPNPSNVHQPPQPLLVVSPTSSDYDVHCRVVNSTAENMSMLSQFHPSQYQASSSSSSLSSSQNQQQQQQNLELKIQQNGSPIRQRNESTNSSLLLNGAPSNPVDNTNLNPGGGIETNSVVVIDSVVERRHAREINVNLTHDEKLKNSMVR